ERGVHAGLFPPWDYECASAVDWQKMGVCHHGRFHLAALIVHLSTGTGRIFRDLAGCSREGERDGRAGKTEQIESTNCNDYADFKAKPPEGVRRRLRGLAGK